MNSNNLISNTELRTLYPNSLNSDADKIAESQMNEVARIKLQGMLEININTNFMGTFKKKSYTLQSSGIISILIRAKMYMIVYVCVSISICAGERFSFV